MANQGKSSSQLAKRIALVDERIVRVMVISPAGELLAVETSRAIPRRNQPPPDELIRRASAFTVGYGGAEGATRYLGKMQYSVFAYEGYKILLLRVPPQEGILSIRLPRDVNAEEVYLKVIHFLNAGS